MIERNWSSQETKLLMELYPNRSNSELANIFGRPISSIEHKASRLGLRKTKEYISQTWSKVRKGEKACNWKGGKKRNKKGYILLKVENHPYSDKQSYIMEHRLIMEKKIGRYLRPDEIVHHKNGIKDDNRIENLEIMEIGEHTIHHCKGKKHSQEAKEKISQKAKERLKNPMNHSCYKNVEIKQLEKLRNKGLTIKEICNLYKISKRTYYNKINKTKGGQAQ